MQLRVLCLGAVPLESKCLFVSDFMGQPCFKVETWYEKSLLVAVRGTTRDQVIQVKTRIPFSPDLLSGDDISRANAVFVLLDVNKSSSLASAQRYLTLLQPYQSTLVLVFVGITDASSSEKNMPITLVEKYAWEMHVMFLEVNLFTGRHVRASFVVVAKKALARRLLESNTRSSRKPEFLAWQPKGRPSSPLNSEPNSSSLGNTPRSQLFQSEISPFRCIRERKMDRLEQLVLKGININSGDEGSLNTLLHLSCLYSDSSWVKYLLDRHAHVNIANAFGQTPLHCAARRTDWTSLRLLIENGADPNARDVYGNTAVHVAVEFGNVDVLQFLDESSADLSALTDKGNSAVSIAAYWGHEEVLLFLHQKGLALDHANSDRHVPFVLAASTGAVACCRYIARILSHVPSKWYSRSLLLTASAGHTECAQYLLESGEGSLTITDEMNALRCALLTKQTAISKFFVNRWLETPDIVYEELKNHDLVVLAVEARMNEVLKTLIELGADYNATRHPHQMTPFLLASRLGDIQLMKTLLGHGCDAHAVDSRGYSALHQAAYGGHPVAIDKLLNLGMNPNQHNSNKESAIMVAIGQGHIKALYKLLDHARSGANAVDPIGLLKTWKDPYLMVVNELLSSDLVPKTVLWRARGFTVGIGIFKGIHVLTYKFEPPVDIRNLGTRVGIMSHFRHPNLPTLLGVLSDGVSYTMVQETGVENFGTLYDVLYREKREFEPIDIIILLLKLLKGLKNMHQELAGVPAIVHRDIRSGNVLLHPEHGPILFNFATASFFTQDVVLAHHGRIGTVGWMAPEVLMGEPFTSGVDIYSFGMLIYEMYEGKMPFEGYHVFDIAPKVMNGDVPKYHEARSKEEKFLVEMMERCWQHRPSLRPSFHELRRHFSQMLEGVEEREIMMPTSPHMVEGGYSSFLDPKIKSLGVVDSNEVSPSSINPFPAKNHQEAVMLYRYEIEGMEYYCKEIPLRIIDPRRFHIFQLRAHDIETLTESLSQRKQSHVLRLMFNDVNSGYVRLITHRYDTTLYDKLRIKATRERMHFSAAQVLDMAKQIIQGQMFLNAQDPPIHHFISDRDIFLREAPGQNPWLMIGDFGLTHLLTAKMQETMLGDGGFIAPEVLQAPTHRFNTVTDRNHALASEASDVFAFGMIIHTILRLSRPFPVEANNCVKQQVELEPTSLSASYRPLIDLALKCTQFHPKSRPTLKEALQMLNKMKNLSTTPDKFRPRVKRAKSSFSVNPLTNVPGQDSTSAAAEPISLPINMRMPSGKMLLAVPNYYLECGAFIAGGESQESRLTPEPMSEHYTRHMAETNHTCFVGAGEKGPVIIVISKAMTTHKDEPGYRGLSRAPTGDEKFFLSSSIRALAPPKKGTAPRTGPPTSKQLLKALNTVYDKFEKYNLKCAGESMKEAQIKLLVNFEKQCVNHAYTIGVVYAAPGQRTISEMLSNERMPPALDNFMEMLGERVKLCNFSQFAGGLDTKYDSTGTSSYYTRIHGCEVMFHVAQMLPYEIEDPQLQRKRFLSKNVCIIVFQDGDAQPLGPDICADWPRNHVIAVVRPVQEKVKHTRVKDLVGRLRSRSPEDSPPNSPGRVREKAQCYQLSFAWKQELRPFAPHLENPIFEEGSFLRYFLLTKLLNGQRAAFVGDTTLRVEREIARAELLSQLGNALVKFRVRGLKLRKQ